MLFDEQALTSAIKSLMGSSTVKRESLETFIKALANKDIKEDYWEELFNSQGAMNALRQNIYGSQMVRLLALRTLVIPTTLTEYLEWLKFDENLNKKKLNQPIITFLQFQSQILPLLSELTDSHLKLTELRQGLEKCRRGWKDYFSLANLFEKIGDYVQEKLSDNQLAILYYKLSAYLGNENGRVSKKLFNKIFPNQNSRQQIWNTVIFKESRKESDIVSKTTVIYLVLFFFAFGATLGGAGGYYWGKSDSSPSSSNPIESPDDQKLNSNNSKNLNTTSNNTKTNNQNNQSIAKSNIPPDKQQKAIDKFETDSLIAITNIIGDIQTSFPTVNRERIIMAFKQNLGDEKLNYDVLWDKNDSQYGKHRDEWIDAIYKYQIKNELDADGIISPKGKTINLLKEKLTAKFNPTSNSLPTSEPIPATGE